MTPERNSPTPKAAAELILRELHALADPGRAAGAQRFSREPLTALGWLLREAGKTDSKRLQAILLRHGPSLPRTSLRYAIERFSEAERQRLLKETRP